ncbi:MAG: prepilin peptidase [archaeon]|jgi:preflagellin peptidase FlaK
MITIFFYTTILVSIIGLITATYTDLKARIVPNTLNYGLTITGLLIFAIQSYFESSPLPFLYSLFGMCFGFFFGWILWKMGVFAGGDVKLFMGLGALNPFTPALLKIGLLSSANIPFFPITLFIYSLIAFLPYGLFVITMKIANNKKFQKELYEEMKPKILAAIHASIFASAAFVLLNFLGINPLLTILIVIIWGILKNKKKYITIISLIIALILNLNLLIQALSATVFLSVIVYTIIKLLFSTKRVLSSEIKVKKLEEGMIPSTSLYFKGKKVLEEKNLDFALIMKCVKEKNSKPLFDLLAPKKEIISARKARGLTEEELKEIKKLAQKGLIPKKIRIKESMPFVPTMLLGYILCLILGDFTLMIFMGLI